MVTIIARTMYIFFFVLEILLLSYMVISWLPVNARWKEYMSAAVNPMLDPIRFLLRHSVLYTQVADLSPIITFILITYLQYFFSSLL